MFTTSVAFSVKKIQIFSYLPIRKENLGGETIQGGKHEHQSSFDLILTYVYVLSVYIHIGTCIAWPLLDYALINNRLACAENATQATKTRLSSNGQGLPDCALPALYWFYNAGHSFNFKEIAPKIQPEIW